MKSACQCGRMECRECRMRAFGQARRMYHFTPGLRDALKAAYGRNKRHLSAALDELVRRTEWPRHAFKAEAVRLGLQKHDRRPWTAAETAYLAEHCGAMSARAMARALGRTVLSVESRAEKLRLSRRIREGYSMADLQVCFGCGYSAVKRWMDRGLLGKVHRNGANRVAERNVERFVRDHPAEYDLRTVDQAWFKGLLFGRLDGGGRE